MECLKEQQDLAQLAQKVAEAESIALGLATNPEGFTSMKVKEEILGKPAECFLTFGDKQIKRLEKAGQIRTRKQKKITIVEDNLSAHKLSAVYELYSPERARSIIDRLEIVRTPKHGSWLNIAECELSVLTRCGLNRRTPTKEDLIKDVNAWYERRSKEQKKVD